MSLEFNPETDFKLLLAVPLIPLLLYVIQIFFGRKLPRQGDWMLTGGMFVAMSITVYMAAKAVYAAYTGQPFEWESQQHGQAFKWLYTIPGVQNVVAGIRYDGLGAAMLAVVGVVSFCVHLFSVGYMHGDRRYHIFFANISLFTFAMLGLVLADNLLFLFVFWEIMGLMSYLLIGHFAHDPGSPRIRHAAAACKKAFLTTRIGDVCLFVGMLMFYQHFHTFRFTELWEAGRDAVAANGGEYPTWMTVAGLFTFGGTVGKSAQFPLHIWLPDAMEGPTPVSAMIHAATMVAAGVFLLGRTFPLMSPDVLAVVTTVGAFTALFAATIGTTVYDIKGVLAYSTISQLGFMVAAVGLGGVVAGMFHMVTHAFFKACLFLCSGSVIHGCHHEQDMRHMGGLRKLMPVTFACMLISTLAIAGIPFFAGFYSKDQIVLAAFTASLTELSGANFFASLALPIAALLTAFYMFRLIFMTFFGEYRGDSVHHATPPPVGGAVISASSVGLRATEDEHGHHPHGDAHGTAHDAHGEDAHGHAHEPHESPWPMTVALSVLALLGIFGGHLWIADLPGSLNITQHPHTWFEEVVTIDSLYGGRFAVADPAHAAESAHAVDGGHGVEHTAHVLALSVSLAVALGGIALAWLIYGRGWKRSQRITGRITAALGDVYGLVANKYHVDEMVNATVIAGSVKLGRGLSWTDTYIVDGFVLLVGRIGVALGAISGWIDRTIIDGAVNLAGGLTQTFGSVTRLLQTGRIQQYITFAVAGGILAAAWMILN